jgi:hypothetical protein
MLRIDVAASTSGTLGNFAQLNPSVMPRMWWFWRHRPEIDAFPGPQPMALGFDRGSGELWLNDERAALEWTRSRSGQVGWRCFRGTNTYNSTCGSNPDPSAGRAVRPHAGFPHHRRPCPQRISNRGAVFGDFAGESVDCE